MRIRIKFTKNNIVKYLGHLDIMRSFQKCFHRAGVKMTYSEGFNPHQKMNFALPLGVGIASKGEYLDAEIADGQDPDEICRNLNAVAGYGFNIVSVKQLKDGAEKAMASVRYASYDIEFPDNTDLHIDDYQKQDTIIIQKTTKTGIKDVDAKNMIIELKQHDNILSVLMKAGNDNNLKPELLAEDILKFNKTEFSRSNIAITRTELYGAGLTPLIDYQTI